MKTQVYRAKTQEEYNKIVQSALNLNFKWISGSKELLADQWKTYKEDTLIFLHDNKGISYSNCMSTYTTDYFELNYTDKNYRNLEVGDKLEEKYERKIWSIYNPYTPTHTLDFDVSNFYTVKGVVQQPENNPIYVLEKDNTNYVFTAEQLEDKKWEIVDNN